ILDIASLNPASASGPTRIQFDKSTADIKKYQDQAQAIVSILKDIPKEDAEESSVKELRKHLVSVTLKDLNDKLKSTKSEPVTGDNAQKYGSTEDEQQVRTSEEDVVPIRPRLVMPAFSQPPIVIPTTP